MDNQSVNKARDFSQGPVWSNIARQTMPLIFANIVQILYNIVDRIFIGHMQGDGSLALTGIGLIFPFVTIIYAFTMLAWTGGSPLFSMARGARQERRAQHILNQVLGLIIVFSLIITVLTYIFRRPILYLFGASDASFPYADAYLRIYILGTFFIMFVSGMNSFITAQGFVRTAMGTTILGSVLNILLDPIFIYYFNMGVTGAAIATVISQGVSAGWVLRFLTGRKNSYRLDVRLMLPRWEFCRRILGLGASGFMFQLTNTLVQISCNVLLNIYGGDLYIGIMTILNSIRELTSVPTHSIPGGASPVISYNYGARQFARVRRAIRVTIASTTVYTLIAWLVVALFPSFWISLFTDDPEMIEAGTHALGIYFAGFAFMAFQSGSQTANTALGHAKLAIFFSLFRKVIIVIPVMYLLTYLGYGTDGIFLAEPISNIAGGLVNLATMYLLVYRPLPKDDEKR